MGGRWTFASTGLECACLAGWVIKDRGARADRVGAADTVARAEGSGGRQAELLVAVDRPNTELVMEGLEDTGTDRDRLDPGRGRVAATFEADGTAYDLEVGWMPARLGGRAFSFEDDDVELDADRGRWGGPIVVTFLLNIESSLPRTASVLLFSFKGGAGSVMEDTGRGFRTLLLRAARGARSPRI